MGAHPQLVVVVPQPDWSKSPAAASFGDPADIAAKIAAFNGVLAEEARSASATWVDLFPLMRKQAEDGLLALYQKCTHLGCSVPYAEGESQFHCPCHGSLFDPKGEVTGGPAPRPRDIFPVEVVNGEVWVNTAQPVERSAYDPGQAVKV